MTESEKKNILKDIENLEGLAKATLELATAIRTGLAGGAVSPPRKGKAKKAALAVLKNRRTNISKKSQL